MQLCVDDQMLLTGPSRILTNNNFKMTYRGCEVEEKQSDEQKEVPEK